MAVYVEVIVLEGVYYLVRTLGMKCEVALKMQGGDGAFQGSNDEKGKFMEPSSVISS